MYKCDLLKEFEMLANQRNWKARALPGGEGGGEEEGARRGRGAGGEGGGRAGERRGGAGAGGEGRGRGVGALDSNSANLFLHLPSNVVKKSRIKT